MTRCRGLVAAAQGNVERGRSPCSRRRSRSTRTSAIRSAQARALLALGIVRRRARQKRGAREAIEAALGGFEQLGAAIWVEKTRSELGRIGGRTREEGLTAAEHRVAALVAEGRTNREVAAALFLGERTVAEPPDPHLRQARRALAHGARPPAPLTNAALPGKVQTF